MGFEAILYIGLLIGASKLFGELMVRIKQPSILGNVLAGVIIGPALLSLVKPIAEIDLFISVGVFFLFFLIGLEEIDLPSLLRILRKRIFVGSAIGFFIPFTAAFLFSTYLDMDFVRAFAIGSVIGASSLGVTAKILTDLGRLKSTVGLEIFTVTAIVEFIAILFTSIVIQMGGSDVHPDILYVGWIIAKILIFFGIAGGFAIFLFPRFLNIVKKHVKLKEASFGITVAIVFLVAYFAEIMGIHGSIGALLLGIALSRISKEEYSEINSKFHAIGYGVFIPIFFAGIGIHFVPNFLELPLYVIVGFMVIVVGVKFAGSYIAAVATRMKPVIPVTAGAMSKGAVDLALMLALLETNLLDETLFSLLVMGTLFMMVISGVLLQKSLGHAAESKEVPQNTILPIYFRRAFDSVLAGQILSKTIPTISKDMTVNEFFATHMDTIKRSYLVMSGDALLGMVSLREISKVPKKDWKKVRMENIMIESIKTTHPEEYLYSVVSKMNEHDFDLIPVSESKDMPHKIIGVINYKDIIKLLTEGTAK